MYERFLDINPEVAKALDEATCYDERIQGVLSTKGTL